MRAIRPPRRRGGLSGRRVQAMVIGLVVLVSTAASTLARACWSTPTRRSTSVAASDGSEVTATGPGEAPPRLAATAHLPGVTAAAGPFPEATVTATIPMSPRPGAAAGPPPGGVFQAH